METILGVRRSLLENVDVVLRTRDIQTLVMLVVECALHETTLRREDAEDIG